MKVRPLELTFGLGACGIGVVFGISKKEICQNRCWLDVAADFVLPFALEAYSGALPWALIGLVFVGCAFRRQ